MNGLTIEGVRDRCPDARSARPGGETMAGVTYSAELKMIVCFH